MKNIFIIMLATNIGFIFAISTLAAQSQAKDNKENEFQKPLALSGGNKFRNPPAEIRIQPKGFRPFVVPRISEMEKSFNIHSLPKEIYDRLIRYRNKCAKIFNVMRPRFPLIASGHIKLRGQVALDIKEFTLKCRDSVKNSNRDWSTWNAGTLTPLSHISNWSRMVSARMAILRKFENGRPAYCSGILIDNNRLLTASHCVHHKDTGNPDEASELEVATFEDPLRWVPGQTVQVDHPGRYSKYKVDKDYAIVVLGDNLQKGLNPLSSWNGSDDLRFGTPLLIPVFDPYSFHAWKNNPSRDKLSSAAKRGDWSEFVFVDSSHYCRSGKRDSASPPSCARHSCVTAAGGSGAAVFALSEQVGSPPTLLGVHHGARKASTSCKDKASKHPYADKSREFQAEPNRAVLVPNSFLAAGSK